MSSSKRLSFESDPTAMDVSSLSTLEVSLAELRLAPDRTWLYVLNVSCGMTRWQVVKRYSEIREFWVHLCNLLMENGHSCPERCHFLAGLENDKFPKKQLLHTRNVLEARANELEDFFLKLGMRLNLCNQVALERCHSKGCSMIMLLTAFFEVGVHYVERHSNPCSKLTSYKSASLRRNRSCGGRREKSGSRRLSLADLRDVRTA